MITMSHKDRTHVSLTETEHDNRSAFLVWHAPNQYYKISIENGSVKHSHNYRRTDGHKFYVYVWYGTPFYVLCFIQSIIITSSISYFYMVQVSILKECYVMTWIIFSKINDLFEIQNTSRSTNLLDFTVLYIILYPQSPKFLLVWHWDEKMPKVKKVHHCV